MTRLAIALLIALALRQPEAAAQSRAPKPEGEMRWALYLTLPPAWFDPGEITGGFLTPFWVLYAMHDALVKPMPGNLMAPSLAESWTVSADQRVYDFKLREGLRVPQRGPLHRRRREVQLPALQGRQGAQGPRARRRDREPVARALPPPRAVPRLHDLLRHARDRRGLDRAEEVRGEGRRRGLQEAAGRPRALPVRELHAGRRARRGGLRGPLAEGALREAHGLQDDPRPHHARRRAEERRGRPRLHARHADRARAQARSRASASDSPARSASTTSSSSTSGIPKSPVARPARAARRQPRRSTARGSARRRRSAPPARRAAWRRARSSSRWRCRPTPTTPPKAKQLLAEAGYPNGFDGGDFYPYPPYWSAGETVVNYFGAVGIRMKVRTMERAAFQTAWAGKKLTGVCLCTLANFGNAATRIVDVVTSDGTFTRGTTPTSRPSSSSRRARRIGASARRCSTRSSRSSTTACGSAPSTSSSG